MLAKDIMKTDVVTIGVHTTIAEAIGVLLKHEISGLIVLDENGKVGGVISEKDVMIAYDFVQRTDIAISEFISRDVISVKADTPIKDVSRTLVQLNIKRVPVIDDGKLVGVISRHDILRSIDIERKRR